MSTCIMFYGGIGIGLNTKIRLAAEKLVQPVNVVWPDPLQELADLLEAQLERDKELLALRRNSKAKKADTAEPTFKNVLEVSKRVRLGAIS